MVIESHTAANSLFRPIIANEMNLGDAKIAAMMAGSELKIAAKSVLVPARADHQFVYRLITGWAGRSRQLPDGRNQFILVFLPGDLFAMKSMFMRSHPDGIVAISALRVERIAQRRLHDAYIADGEIATRCMFQIVEEERRLHSWVVALGQGSAEERLALMLIEWRDRLILSGHIAPDDLSYVMPMTQVQLADHAGVTPVHVNRVFKIFRDQSIVTIRRGKVIIDNLDALKDRASALLDVYELASAGFDGYRSDRNT
jgi:CRP-like cAMP-binding protein